MRNALRTLTEGDVFIDEQNHTSLRTTVLSLIGLNLTGELQIHPELLDFPAAMSRAPPTLAACRGDERALFSLLQHGAAVNTLDLQHTNAVFYAAQQDFTAYVLLLLEAIAGPRIAKATRIPAADLINVAARNASNVSLVQCRTLSKPQTDLL